jgi:translation initiation factor IF-1
MARRPKGSKVSFNDSETGRIVDARITEHKLSASGEHKYRARVDGSKKRVWLTEKDLVH